MGLHPCGAAIPPIRSCAMAMVTGSSASRRGFVKYVISENSRNSTIEQELKNQIREIEAAGFGIEPHRIITETVSGSMAIAQREGFSRLLDKMEKGDVLVVTKLDRLGRDAIGARHSIYCNADKSIRNPPLGQGHPRSWTLTSLGKKAPGQDRHRRPYPGASRINVPTSLQKPHPGFRHPESRPASRQGPR